MSPWSAADQLWRWAETEMRKQKRSFVVSILAGLFALVWISAGIGALVFGSNKERGWVIYLVAPLAIAYGLVWVIVMLNGRQLKNGELMSGFQALAKLDFDHFRK